MWLYGVCSVVEVMYGMLSGVRRAELFDLWTYRGNLILAADDKEINDV